MHTLSAPATPSATATLAASQPPLTAVPSSLDSSDLLQGQKAVSIVHNGTTYRLQATKLGKLILTK